MSWFRRDAATGGDWQKCGGCAEILPRAELTTASAVCPRCGHHHPLPALRCVELLVDPDSFAPLGADVRPKDPLGFKDLRRYRERLKVAQKETGLDEALVAGSAHLDGQPVVLAVLAGEFLEGSLGTTAGERLARACERAAAGRCPLIFWATGVGGLRLQEGQAALMALARIANARAELAAAKLPVIAVLSAASDQRLAAGLLLDADVRLAEPSAASLFAAGLVDRVVQRHELRGQLSMLVRALYRPRAL